uniref:Beta-defensin n=1 Tax=Saimiri boliviensis boliviensis TaxID=39432 RepID=A0A2K6SL64_SAIBB
MRVLLFIFGVLALLFTVSAARSSNFDTPCVGKYYNCRPQCNADEYTVRYCAEYDVCCRVKKRRFVGTKW